MVATKKRNGLTKDLSWRTFFLALSVAVNIGLVVFVATLMTSNALDTLLMREGLSRYCAPENNDKFADASEKTKAFREYTCGAGTAKDYFAEGLEKYYEYKGIK
jgi:hypothetical protein